MVRKTAAVPLRVVKALTRNRAFSPKAMAKVEFEIAFEFRPLILRHHRIKHDAHVFAFQRFCLDAAQLAMDANDRLAKRA